MLNPYIVIKYPQETTAGVLKKKNKIFFFKLQFCIFTATIS